RSKIQEQFLNFIARGTRPNQLFLTEAVDRWGEKNISAICREGRQKKYRLGISNPCFEVWLYLHFDDNEVSFKLQKPV
ncbi:MAG: RloB domain-containing protein, partial [Microcoleus sp. SU_5_6]|nr:RloB domain-containing protein [Microcoleus sp. SU_5_6]